MPWFKTDDSFWRHRKVRKLGRRKVTVPAQVAAAGLWLLTGDWSADTDEDGFAPWETVEGWDAQRKLAEMLIHVGLWEETEQDGELGIRFHDWPDYQRTTRSIEEDRERWRKRKDKQRSGKSPPDSQDHMSRVTPPGTTSGTPPGSHNGSHVPGHAPSHGDVRIPDPVPDPNPFPGGHLEEGGSAAVDAGERPPPRCDQHKHDENPPACGACAEARRRAERADAEADEQAAEQRRQLAEQLEQARRNRSLECQHGTPAGLFTRPDTGTSPCAQCRAQQRQEATT